MSSIIHACVVAHLVLITVDYSSSVNIVIIYFQKKQFIKNIFNIFLCLTIFQVYLKKQKSNFL